MAIPLAALSTIVGSLLALGSLRRRYRRDLASAQARLASLDRTILETEYGPLEFAEEGSGDTVLVSHGIFHGSDGGLLSVHDLIDGHRVVAPSRFGYLGTALPPGATGADQADGFAALLGHLGLDAVDLIGISAGTGPAIQFALRYPERISHLVLSSGNFPGNTGAQAPPSWAKIFYSDWAMWALKTFARPMFARLMGIPKGFPKDTDDAQMMDQMMDSIFPVAPRAEGAIFDAYISNPEINTYPLEELRVPTLIVHTRDDPLASYDAAAEAATRIPASTLVTLDSGGHLQLGQSARIRAEISAFLPPSSAQPKRSRSASSMPQLDDVDACRGQVGDQSVEL